MMDLSATQEGGETDAALVPVDRRHSMEVDEAEGGLRPPLADKENRKAELQRGGE